MSVDTIDPNFLKTFGSIDPFDIPNASEENKELQRQLKEKLALAELLRERASKFDEKIQIVTQHLRNVNDDRSAVEALISSKERELETEYLAVRDAETQIRKYRRHITDLEKEDLLLHEKCAESKEKIAASAIRIAKIRTELHWDDETYREWSDKLAKKNDDNLTMLRYAEIDEIRIKELTMKLEKLSTETEETKNRVAKANAEKNACENRLKKSSRELESLHKQKADLATKWEQVVEKISERDSEAQELLKEAEKAEEALREAQERRNIEENALEREKFNVKEMGMIVADLQAQQAELKSQLDGAVSQKEKTSKELDSIQMTLDRDRKELEKLRSKNKETERIILQKTCETDKIVQAIEELQRKQNESSEEACTAAQKAQMAKDLLEESEAYRHSLIEKVERLTQAKAKKNNEVKSLEKTTQTLVNQIGTTKKEIKKTETSNKETEDAIRSKEEAGYKLDFRIVKLDKEIAAYTGKTDPGSTESQICKELKEAKGWLETELEKLKKDNFNLETENQRACEQLKRARISFNKALQEKDKAEEKLKDLDIEVNKAMKSFKELKNEKENFLVERNLLQVDVHKNVKKLRTSAVAFSNSRKDQLETERLCKEEEEESKAELEMLKGQLKVVQDDRARLHMSLNDRTDKADKSKKRYETIVEAIGGSKPPKTTSDEGKTSKMTVASSSTTPASVIANKKKLALLAPNTLAGDDCDMKTASYFIVRRAQEKQELEQKIADMEAQVAESRSELAACERTLALIQGNNAMFRKQTKDATARVAETDEDGLNKLRAEEEYESARIELNMKTLELKETKQNFEAQDAYVDKLKAEVESRGKQIEDLQERKTKLEREVTEQVRRLQIVTNRINRLTKELKAQDKMNGGHGNEYSEFQKDMELKKLKEKNKKVMKRLRELAQTDIAIWASVERAFLENDLPLSYLSVPLDTTSSGSSTDGRATRDDLTTTRSGSRRGPVRTNSTTSKLSGFARTESLLATSEAESCDSRASPAIATSNGTSSRRSSKDVK